MNFIQKAAFALSTMFCLSAAPKLSAAPYNPMPTYNPAVHNALFNNNHSSGGTPAGWDIPCLWAAGTIVGGLLTLGFAANGSRGLTGIFGACTIGALGASCYTAYQTYQQDKQYEVSVVTRVDLEGGIGYEPVFNKNGLYIYAEENGKRSCIYKNESKEIVQSKLEFELDDGELIILKVNDNPAPNRGLVIPLN